MISQEQENDYRARLTFSYLVGVQSHVEQGISTLDGMLPLFAPILQPMGGQIFDPARVATDFSSVYGSKIHPYAVTSIAHKLYESGYLKESGRDSRTNSVVYTVSSSIEVEANVGETEVDSLFLSFREFAHAETARHSLPAFENEELDKAFVTRLQSFPLPDQSALKIRDADKTGSNTLSLPKFTKVDEAEILAERKSQWLNAIFSDYVLSKASVSSEQYNLFQKIATGSIVVEAVLNFCGPKTEKSFQNTWFIVDTPLLMDLLDLDSPERHIFAMDLLSQLKNAKARIGVFQHSIVETSHNIKAALAAYGDRNSHGAIGIRMISNIDFVRRIASVKQNLKDEVKAFGFTIFETPSSPHALGFLSADLENQISNNIGNYGNDYARLRDASSIAGIVRLRGNHKSSRQDFAATKYIFLTRNSRLTYLSENYLIAQRVYDPEDMPAAVTDSSLAAVLWLMFGSQDSANLPYKRLLANCTAIPQTDQNIRDRVLRLISDDTSELAKSFQVWSRTPRGAEVMVRKALGDPNLVTLENISEFIESVKAAAGSEAAEAVKQEKELQIKQLLDNQEAAAARFESEKAAILQEVEKNSDELNVVKATLSSLSSANNIKMEQLNNQYSTLVEKLEDTLEAHAKDREHVLKSLVDRTAEIQRKWDMGLAAAAGCAAASLGVSIYVFDKYYTVSEFWDFKIIVLLFIFTGMLTMIAFGAAPKLLFQSFINRRKRAFVESQLRLIGYASLTEDYEVDYTAHTFRRR